MTTAADRPTTKPLRVVGTRPVRPDGPDKVTGRAKYGADIQFPGLLHAKILRSPHAHARIRSIDTSRAEALQGVRAVITSKDFSIIDDQPIDLGEARAYPRMLAENMMAGYKALYVGHPLAAVAAESPHVAEEALELIEVDYDVLPPLMTLTEAMPNDAPVIHDLATTRSAAELFSPGEDTGVKSNVATHLQFKRGDVDKGFSEAYLIVEREFSTAMVHQGYIEPHASTGFWAPDGQVTIWESTQGPFAIRAETAAVLGIPESSIKIVPTEIGGGFGGKLGTLQAPVVALLSKKSGHPVKSVMTRKEDLEATGPSSGTAVRCKIGVDKGGRIVAAELSLAYEAGAFPGSSVQCGTACGLTAYKTDNLLIDGYDVIVNRPKAGAFRAPGAPQAAFGVEQVMDEIAEKLSTDPLELRLKNAVETGDPQPNGLPLASIGCAELIQAMRQHPHYQTPPEGPNRGRGVSIGYWFNAAFPATATINVNTSGSIGLVTGAVDIGGTRAALAMVAAEMLGLPLEDVHPTVGDTDTAGWNGVTGGSRTAIDTAQAVMAAAEEVKRQMTTRAAMLWEVTPDHVGFEDGIFTSRKDPSDKATFKDLAAQLLATGGPISASGSFTPNMAAPTVSGAIADVEVDTETGKVTVLRYTVFQDAGKALHPSYVEGQMQGGSSQGIGWALNEEYFYDDDGAMANSSLLDYRMPTSIDLPMIDPVIVETPNPDHPFGCRGVGEVSIVPPMAAIANAVYHAIGTRMTELPMSPGAVLRALQATRDGASE